MSPKQEIRSFPILIILILVPINCWWIVATIVTGQTSPTHIPLYFPTIFTLLILIGFGAIIGRINPKFALNRIELLTLYTCISIGSSLAGGDRFYVLLPLIGHAHQFATPENDWAELFHAYIPSYITISDKRILEGYYHGFSSFYDATIFLTWLPIALWWSAFVFALHLVMIGINLILRKQWIESERLSYPIIQLPIEMTRSRGSFFRSPWMWFGLAIGATVNIVNGLNFLFPSVPSFGGKLYDLRRIFTERPLSAIGWSPIAIFPFGVGLSFFIPLDLSFSCWAFWLIWRIERVVGGVIGWRGLPRFPYEPEQSHGAYLGLCVVALWMSRGHLKNVFRSIFDRDRADSTLHRTALISIAGGFGFIIFFCLKMGMSIAFIFLFFVLWFMISIAVTRLRAELGSPVHDLHFIGPDEILPRIVGIRRIGSQNLVGFSYLYFLNRAHRSHVMPHQLEGFKLADESKTPLRSLSILMMISTLIGAIASFWAFLHLAYRRGGIAWPGNESFRRLERWFSHAVPPDLPAIGFIIFGFAITVILSILRMNFLWWELHPVGYAISGSWAINPMIGSIFVGWLLKWIVLKYGGIRLHRSAIPFFLGLVLGEFLIGAFWSFLGIALDQPLYRFIF